MISPGIPKLWQAIVELILRGVCAVSKVYNCYVTKLYNQPVSRRMTRTAYIYKVVLSCSKYTCLRVEGLHGHEGNIAGTALLAVWHVAWIIGFGNFIYCDVSASQLHATMARCMHGVQYIMQLRTGGYNSTCISMHFKSCTTGLECLILPS